MTNVSVVPIWAKGFKPKKRQKIRGFFSIGKQRIPQPKLSKPEMTAIMKKALSQPKFLQAQRKRGAIWEA